MNPSVEFGILAGGKSLRMGSDKGLIPLGSKPMICYLLDTLSFFGFPIHIVTPNEKYQIFGFRVFKDSIADKGPMGGLLTSLQNCRSSHLVLLSCDSPFVSTNAIQKLINSITGQMISVALIEQRMNPLLAIYPVSVLYRLQECIHEDKLKMTTFIESQPHLTIDMQEFILEDPLEFYNINSPSDVIHCKIKWQ